MQAISVVDIPFDSRWAIVASTGEAVEKALREMNAAEKWITIGGALAGMKKELARVHGGDRRSKKVKDDNRPTWEKAFQGRRFPFDQTKADRLVTINSFFKSPNGQLENATYLPTSWRTLYELAFGFKDHQNLFREAMRASKISRTMTREEAKRVVKSMVHGKGDNEPPKTKEKRWRTPVAATASKKDRLAAAFECIAYLKLNLEDLADHAHCKLVEERGH